MSPLDLVNITPLMELTSGTSEVAIGMVDGPVAVNHPDFASADIREVPGKSCAACSQMASVAYKHGTFVASILIARRGSPAPAICPGCTLLVRPIFAEPAGAGEQIPNTTPEELATALIESIGAGARVLNLSATLAQPSPNGQRRARRGPRLCGEAGRHRGRGGGESGVHWEYAHHPPSVGHPGDRLRSRGAADRPVEPGKFHRQARSECAGDQITGLGAKNQPVTLGGEALRSPSSREPPHCSGRYSPPRRRPR